MNKQEMFIQELNNIVQTLLLRVKILPHLNVQVRTHGGYRCHPISFDVSAGDSSDRYILGWALKNKIVPLSRFTRDQIADVLLAEGYHPYLMNIKDLGEKIEFLRAQYKKEQTQEIIRVRQLLAPLQEKTKEIIWTFAYGKDVQSVLAVLNELKSFKFPGEK